MLLLNSYTALLSVVLSQCTPNLLKIYVSTNNSHYMSHISFQKKLSYEDTCMHGSQACSFSILFGRVVYIRKSGLASIILGYHSTIFHPPSRSICPLPGSELWESCLKSASVKHKEEEDWIFLSNYACHWVSVLGRAKRPHAFLSREGKVHIVNHLSNF